MALNLTAEQRLMNAQTVATLNVMGSSVKVYGKRGVLLHFGITPDAETGSLGSAGVLRSATRGAHKRSRWLGDTVGTSVSQNTASAYFYPSRRGNAIPGSPIVLQNLTTGKKWTVQLSGEIGVFVAWLTSRTRDFDIQLYGKTGNPYKEPILGDGGNA